MPAPTLHTPANPVIEVDINGLPIDSPTTTSGRYIQGNVASGTLDAGNPVKVGGEFNTTLPTFTNGMRGDLQLTNRGGLLVTLRDESGNSFIVNRATDANASANGLAVWNHGLIWNGTTWDRQRDANSSNASTGTGIVGAGVLGKYNATPPTYASGQYGNIQLSNRGMLLTQLGDGDKVAAINYGSTDAVPFGTIPGLLTVAQNYVWNGASYDRARGDTTGSWSHAPQNSASSVLSGATSGATAAIAFTNTARQEVINPSTSTLWASWGTPAVNGAGSFPIIAGGSFSTDRTTGTLTLLSTVATQPFTVNRYA